MIDLISHKLITSNGQVIVLRTQKNDRKTPVLFVRVTANVRLPAYSEMEILADVDDFVHENQTYILEGDELQTTNVLVACAVVTPGVSVPVCVMNPTHQPVILYKDTAHLTEVKEVDDGSMLEICHLSWRWHYAH